MSVRYHVRHLTRYTYGAEVMRSQQLLHLVPRPAPYQRCLEHRIEITPEGRRSDALDAFGNPIVRLEIDHPHRELSVLSTMQIDVFPRPRLPAHESLPWERVVEDFRYRALPPGRDTLEAARFRHESPHVHIKQLFGDYAADCFPSQQPVLLGAESLMRKIHAEFRYAPGTTEVGTTVGEVFAARRGVCQDFAHVMIACLRARALAARYVSGYVRGVASTAADDPASAAPAARTAPLGGGASHAWVSVYAPPFGWVDLDPTNAVAAGTDHIAIAWGRDFGDVSPLRGIILGGASHTLEVAVEVEPIAVTSDAPASLA